MFAKISMLAIMVSFSVNVFANDQITTILQEEQILARKTCELIQTDQQWKQIASNLSTVQKFYMQYPSGKPVSEFITSANKGGDLTRAGYRFVNKTHYEEMKDSSEFKRNFYDALNSIRFFRVINECGDQLLSSGLIYPQRAFNSTIGPIAYQQGIDKLKKEASCVAEYDRKLINNFREAENYKVPEGEQYNPAIGKLTTEMNDQCHKSATDISELVIFPAHFLLQEKGKQFYENNADLIKESLDYLKTNSESLVVKLPKAIEVKKTQEENTIKRNERIEAIQEGDFEVAESCDEVAEALIPKEQLQAIERRVFISKDVSSIQPKPSFNYFAAISEIAHMEGNVIYAIDTNSFTGKMKAYILKNNEATVWVKNNIESGRVIYFVGQYTENHVVSYGPANNRGSINARGVELVCATTF